MAFFHDNLGKPAAERQTILDFTGARDDVVAVASAEPYSNHLHLAPDKVIMPVPVPRHSVFYRLDALPATQPTASKH